MLSFSAPVLRRVLLLVFCSIWLNAKAAEFQRSYAVVIGINPYASARWHTLSYAREDARAVANYLRTQGYVVSELYDQQATKHAILSALHSLASKVTSNDRVVVFIAGHGANERFGDDVWGYLIPYDGVDAASYLSYTELQDASRMMNAARHQLFIMDACFSGLMLKTRSGGVSPDVPNYLDEVTKRIAREVLTAGGDMQEVLDTGPNGHSVFTNALLEGLMGAADFNRDGYITFAELESYVTQRASNSFQTPDAGVLPGNGGGEFIFRSPLGARKSWIAAEPTPEIIFKRGETDQLSHAKELLEANQFSEALALFQLSASTGNSEALYWVGLIYNNGWGVSQNYTQAISWYRKAAEAGNAKAMTNLGVMYEKGHGLRMDLTQAVRWYQKAADADDENGMNNLGVMYENGSGGLPQDDIQAISWYRKAADRGSTQAMCNLGDMYGSGRGGPGVPGGDDEALRWYQKAANAGDKSAKAYLDDLNKLAAKRRRHWW